MKGKGRKSNPILLDIVKELRRAAKLNNAPIWDSIAERMKAPRRLMAQVNLSKINRFSEDGETILVPGKVLGTGKLDHRVTVAALSFSKEAKRRIEETSGRCISIKSLIEENPKGSEVKILA
ncbi:50S ribosomal protein L18e [Candidatus Bathyarchaeota archaeon]|nr:50S ribosomal protein L18e [Candidatus Bathyarchaeota archaeon]